MPDAVSDSGDISAANLSSTGGQVLQGYVQTYATGADANAAPSGEPELEGWGGSPLFQTGIDTTVLQGGIDYTDVLPNDVLQAGIEKSSLAGKTFQIPTGGSFNPTKLNAGVSSQPVVTTQVVKADIRNTVVQPLEPCRSAPYLKLVFLPVDTDVRFRRDLRREAAVPFPSPQQKTISEFVANFAGKVHTKDARYLLRWLQVLPVVVQPQDSGSVSYKSVDTYDISTSILLNDSGLVSLLDFSQLPLTQVTKAEDIQGGTTNPELQDYELYLDDVIYADLDQATGKLTSKDPVEAGLFLPEMTTI